MTQYRCETCTNKDDCDEYESQAVRDVSIRCGLTCHSDFQSERDKVLDKFKDCIMRVDLLKKYFDIQMPVAKVE